MGKPANPCAEPFPSPGWSRPAQAPWLLRCWPAMLLLIPYLLWSPVGTLMTWQMQRLNR